MLAGQSYVLGMLADLMAANRKLIQDTRARVREMQLCEDRQAGDSSREVPTQ